MSFLATIIFFIIFNIAFVGLRIWSRRIAAVPYGWDDYLIIPSLLINLGMCIIAIVFVERAYSNLSLDLLETEYPDSHILSGELTYIFELFYIVAVVLPKLSIICLYLRIMTARSTRILVYITMAVLSANWLAFMLVAIFQCLPIEHQWDHSITGYCIDITAFFRASGIPNILTDVAILILPLPMIWRLHASTMKKLGLTIVFLMGSVGLTAACVRVYIFLTRDVSSNFEVYSATLLVWSIIEPSMYLIAACQISFRALLVALASKWSETRFYSHCSLRPCLGTRASHLGGQSEGVVDDAEYQIDAKRSFSLRSGDENGPEDELRQGSLPSRHVDRKDASEFV